jgi:response regulator RpfG family c-di-GMP phosphodiesterase
VEDIDEVLAELTDERGQFRDPRLVQQVAALQREQDGAEGSQAEEAYR